MHIDYILKLIAFNRNIITRKIRVTLLLFYIEAIVNIDN